MPIVVPKVSFFDTFGTTIGILVLGDGLSEFVKVVMRRWEASPPSATSHE